MENYKLAMNIAIHLYCFLRIFRFTAIYRFLLFAYCVSCFYFAVWIFLLILIADRNHFHCEISYQSGWFKQKINVLLLFSCWIVSKMRVWIYTNWTFLFIQFFTNEGSINDMGNSIFQNNSVLCVSSYWI